MYLHYIIIHNYPPSSSVWVNHCL
uniref:Uncharacterized protein n=1 Tax=Lepeophtheirus salmonis TaxID=72036 RepID=A0A0K2TP04_LEPSM